MSELPKGWAGATFGDVTASVSNGIGGTQSKDGLGIPVSRIETIADQTINLDRVGYLAEYDPSKIERYRLNKGDILFSHINSPVHLGKTAMFDEGATLYHGINLLRIVVKQEVLLPQIFNYYCKLTRFQGIFAMRAQHAVNQSSINQKTLATFEIPVAPLPEQKRIADKLDSVLARVEACRDRLDRLPALLKRFRQSILAAATSGRLTEDWRTTRSPDEVQRNPGTAAELLAQIAKQQAAAKVSNRGGKIEPSLTDLPDAIDLPKDWEVAGFDALAAPLKNALKAGPFGSALKKHMYVPAGYKIYGQEQVIAGDENIGDYFIDEEKFQELSNCAIRPGDILISLVGTIGRVLILSEHAKPGIINPRLVKLSLHAAVSRDYISLYLASPTAQNFFGAQSHGGTMDILNLGILRELPILLPSPSEQIEIVRRVETLFAFADRLEARLATARKQAEQLTPALLAKAFRGELVPQDPNDEPASELLKRLATPRSKAPKAKRGRKAAA